MTFEERVEAVLRAFAKGVCVRVPEVAPSYAEDVRSYMVEALKAGFSDLYGEKPTAMIVGLENVTFKAIDRPFGG